MVGGPPKIDTFRRFCFRRDLSGDIKDLRVAIVETSCVRSRRVDIFPSENRWRKSRLQLSASLTQSGKSHAGRKLVQPGFERQPVRRIQNPARRKTPLFL